MEGDKMPKLNKRGFTLVELLMVMIILGIISGFSMVLIRNIQEKNRDRKYEVYIDSLIAGAKLYVDSYAEYDFTSNWTCYDISFEALENKMLAKDFPDKNISCKKNRYNGGKYTYIRVINNSGKYKYEYFVEFTTDNDPYHYLTRENISSKTLSCTKIDT